MKPSYRGDFSCCGAQTLGHRASVVAACGSVAVAHGLWSRGWILWCLGLVCSASCRIFTNPGLNLCSPALAGRFLSPMPSEKSSDFFSFYEIIADPQNFCFCEFYLVTIYQLGLKTKIFIKMYDSLFLINSLCISVKHKIFLMKYNFSKQWQNGVEKSSIVLYFAAAFSYLLVTLVACDMSLWFKCEENPASRRACSWEGREEYFPKKYSSQKGMDFFF